MDKFNKRTFTILEQFQEVMAIAGKGRILLKALGSKYVSEVFKERIMLAVTQVNQCKYCSYFHSKVALEAGVPDDQIKDIAEGEFGNVPEDERTALFFGEHWAETIGNPDKEALDKLRETYKDNISEIIIMNIRLIMIGNRLGNTFESLLLRLKGKPAAEGFFLKEAGILLSWIVIFPLALLRLIFSLITGF